MAVRAGSPELVEAAYLLRSLVVNSLFHEVVRLVLLADSLPLGPMKWWSPVQMLHLRSVCSAFRQERDTGEFLGAILLRLGVRARPSLYGVPCLRQVAVHIFNERTFLHGLRAVAAQAAGYPMSDDRVNNLVHVAGSFGLHRYSFLSQDGAVAGARQPLFVDHKWQPKDVDIWLASSADCDIDHKVLCALSEFCKSAFRTFAADSCMIVATSTMGDVSHPFGLLGHAASDYELMADHERHERRRFTSYSKIEASLALHQLMPQLSHAQISALMGGLPDILGRRTRPYSLCHVATVWSCGFSLPSPFTAWSFPTSINIMLYTSTTLPMPLSASQIVGGFDIVPAMVAMKVNSDLREEFSLSPIVAQSIAKSKVALGLSAFRPAKLWLSIADHDSDAARQAAITYAITKQAERIAKYIQRGFGVC